MSKRTPYPQPSDVILVDMLILLLVLAWVASGQIAPPPDVQFTAIELVVPHTRDSGFVDPKYNITCLGDLSAIPWAWQHYNGLSMQKSCAASRYGGSSHLDLNFGGYCEGQDVAFTLRAWTHRERSPGRIRNLLRALLECRTRCFCNHGLENPNEQPKLVPITRKTFSGPVLDQERKDTITVDTRAPPSLTRPIHLTRLLLNRPTLQIDLGILRTNMIQCGGPLPVFDLPGPWSVGDFDNNTELCAVQLSGGSPAANAGAYCHRDGTAGKVVAFADDMTPRWDWTWSSSATFLSTASLRFHCWKNCLCAPPSRKPNYTDPLIPMWDFMVARLPQSGFSVGRGNRNPLGSSTDARGRSKTSASGGNQPAAQCTADLDSPDTCSIPWRIDIMGPVPDSIAKLTPPLPLSPDGNTNQQCGNRCDSNANCGSDCLCKIPSVEEAQALGLDPIPAIAICITLASVFGRSLDEPSGQVECLCNATYISAECCHTRDGLVQIG